jgi:cytokinin dehydrogenase
MLYNDFSAFSRDQEHLISINGRKQAFDYLEGMLLLNQAPPPDVSFFPEPDQPRIISLVTQHGIIYCIEAAIYYDDRTVNTVDKVHYVFLQTGCFDSI